MSGEVRRRGPARTEHTSRGVACGCLLAFTLFITSTLYLPRFKVYNGETDSPWYLGLQAGTIPAVSTGKLSSKSPPRKSTVKRQLSPRGRGSVQPLSDPDQLLRLFAQNVRLVRGQRRLSQEALADACSLDRTYISGIERGLRNLGIRNIQRIAEALVVDVRDLFDPELAARLSAVTAA